MFSGYKFFVAEDIYSMKCFKIVHFSLHDLHVYNLCLLYTTELLHYQKIMMLLFCRILAFMSAVVINQADALELGSRVKNP